MAERPIAAVLKTVDPQGSVGSNPTPSAISPNKEPLKAVMYWPKRFSEGNYGILAVL
jgi:hypothetical protein